MKLRRYKKTRDDTGQFRMEACDSSEFVAFWSDCKYVSARDWAGQEWLLQGGLSLLKIEEGATGLVRIHRDCLVRRDAIESVQNLHSATERPRHGVFMVAGHEYESSRRYRRGWPVGRYKAAPQAA